MSNYTISLRNVCEIYGRDEVENWFKNYNLSDYLTQPQIALITDSNVWSKDKLANKIVNHYFMRDIGFETPFLFKHYAEFTMKEIMEKYLPLIYTTFLKYDPLVNEDYSESYTREIAGSQNNTVKSDNTGNSTSNSNSNSSSFSVNSDTPQSNINKEALLNGSYATSTQASQNESKISDNTINTSTTNSSSDLNNNTLEKFTKSQKGNRGVLITHQLLIQQYRNNIIAIDSEIIKELDSLFFGLF